MLVNMPTCESLVNWLEIEAFNALATSHFPCFVALQLHWVFWQAWRDLQAARLGASLLCRCKTLIRCFWYLLAALLRLVQLLLYAVKYRLAATERARRKLWEDQIRPYGAKITDHTTIFLLGLVFSLINPIILPFTMLYFVVVTVTERYQV